MTHHVRASAFTRTVHGGQSCCWYEIVCDVRVRAKRNSEISKGQQCHRQEKRIHNRLTNRHCTAPLQCCYRLMASLRLHTSNIAFKSNIIQMIHLIPISVLLNTCRLGRCLIVIRSLWCHLQRCLRLLLFFWGASSYFYSTLTHARFLLDAAARFFFPHSLVIRIAVIYVFPIRRCAAHIAFFSFFFFLWFLWSRTK